MDYISQYPDIDALPAIDKVSFCQNLFFYRLIFDGYFFGQEFDYPHIKHAVQQLVEAEMKSFAPRDYISEIPKLLSEAELSDIVKRIEEVLQFPFIGCISDPYLH